MISWKLKTENKGLFIFKAILYLGKYGIWHGLNFPIKNRTVSQLIGHVHKLSDTEALQILPLQKKKRTGENTAVLYNLYF